MLVWEMLITADGKRDLTQPSSYRLWFHELFRWKPANIRVEGESVKADIPNEDNPPPAMGLLPFTAAWDLPGEGLWCPALCEMWEQGIHALRFAVGQLRKVKTRRTGIEAELAMKVWSDYLSRLQIVVRFHNGQFVRFQTVAMLGSSLNTALWESLDQRQRELARSIDMLFSKAFASLIDGVSADHFCADCGRAMDATTPTGRQSRASVCPKCSFARWKKQVGPKGLREQWKKDKKREREGGTKRKPT